MMIPVGLPSTIILRYSPGRNRPPSYARSFSWPRSAIPESLMLSIIPGTLSTQLTEATTLPSPRKVALPFPSSQPLIFIFYLPPGLSLAAHSVAVHVPVGLSDADLHPGNGLGVCIFG